MSRTYSRRTCSVCKEQITAAGAAFVSHMRKHVREGLAEEVLHPAQYGIREHLSFNRVKTVSPTTVVKTYDIDPCQGAAALFTTFTLTGYTVKGIERKGRKVKVTYVKGG